MNCVSDRNEKRVYNRYTIEFQKDNIKVKVEPKEVFQKKYFNIVIKGPINIFVDICILDDQISPGMTISLPRGLIEDISNILGIEIEKDGEINKLILDQNIAILDFVPTIYEVDRLKVKEVNASIGSRREKCEEILITGDVFVFIDYIFHPDLRIFISVNIPIELIKFIGNSLGIETKRIVILDKNIHLKCI